MEATVYNGLGKRMLHEVSMDFKSLIPILALNAISGTCALLVVLMVFVFARKQPVVWRRVSLRLQTGISLINFVKHFLFFFSHRGDDSFLCSFYGFLMMALEQMYLFLNVAIALNLHLIVIKDCSPAPRWETLYWLVPSILVIGLNTPLLALRIFGKSNSKTCMIKNGTPLNDTLEMLYYNIPSILAITYCITIAIIVYIRLRKNSTILKELPANLDLLIIAEREAIIAGMRSLVLRSTLYPTACFLTNVGINVHTMYDYFHDQPRPVLRAWAALGYSSAGILNLIAFLSDTLVQKNFGAIFPVAQRDPKPTDSSFTKVITIMFASEPCQSEKEANDPTQGFVRYT